MDQTVAKPATNGFGVAALVLGIIGVVFSVLFGGVLGALAITFGAVGRTRPNTGMATAGLVLGIIALCIQVLVLLTFKHPLMG